MTLTNNSILLQMNELRSISILSAVARNTCVHNICSFSASTYTCLAIALERYLGICSAQSDNSFVVRKARYYVIGILVISTVIDLPRFFELTTMTDKEGNIAGFVYTKLRNDPTYITAYIVWFRLIVTAALPLVLMVFFNVKILIYFKRHR